MHTPIDRQVLETLAAHGPLHVMDLADRLGHDPVAVDQACSRLQTNNYILALGGGRYSLKERSSWKPAAPCTPHP